MTSAIYEPDPHRGGLPWVWFAPILCILLIGFVWLCKRAVSGGGAPIAAD